MAVVQTFPVSTMQFVDEDGNITIPWRKFLETLWTRTGTAQGNFGTLSGSIVVWAGSVIPTGYLLCDGTAISRTDYADLFSAIGTEWGIGNGVTTFNVPDFRGRTLIGSGGSYAFGDYGGTSAVTITQANLPSTPLSVTDPGHTHVVTDPGHAHEGGTLLGGTQGQLLVGFDFGLTSNVQTGITIADATTGITVTTGGTDTPLDILPPYAVVNALIKT